MLSPNTPLFGSLTLVSWRFRSCLGMIVVLAFGGACGSGGGPSAAQIWCDGVCAAVHRCNFNAPSCSSECVRQRPGLASESANGAAAQKPCLEQLTCQALSGDDAAWTQELDACWTQAQMSVDVTDRVRRFCPAHALAWFECGYALSLDECEHGYSMWADFVIDRLEDCEANVDCTKFHACEKNVFDNL